MNQLESDGGHPTCGMIAKSLVIPGPMQRTPPRLWTCHPRLPCRMQTVLTERKAAPGGAAAGRCTKACVAAE